MSNLKILNKFIGQEITVIVVKSHVFRCKDLNFSNNFVKVTDDNNIVSINTAAISYIDFHKTDDVYKIAYKSSEMVSGVMIAIDQKFIEIEITNFHTKKTYNVIIPIRGIEGIKVFNEDKQE